MAENRRKPTRTGWRRYLPTRKQVLFGALGAFVVVVGLVIVGYLTTDIPAASEVVRKQTTYVTYSDGGTPIGRLGDINRSIIPLSQVPKGVQHAVLAAEDRNYYSEPGISPTGILRALWVDLRGGDIQQGGSTITQQYAKNAYLTQERTFTRKIKEIFIAVKLDHSRSKDEVLADYLNTIYFGRGAYGIQAAAHAYFHTDARQLSVAQGAVLAALIRSPSGLDPANDKAGNERRWHYVLQGMVASHWLGAGDALAMQYPDVAPPSQGQLTSGPNGFVMQAVKSELARHGFDEARLNLGGYTVVTTIDKNAQDAAIKAEDQIMADHRAKDGQPLSALVSVQPGNGAIRAMYGGRDFGAAGIPKSFVNLVYEPRQPGSSFKAYTLVTALKQGISLNSVYDGTSPKHVKGYGAKEEVSNDSNEQCYYPCSLVKATAESINTVYVPLAVQVGPQKVRQTAYDSGVSDNLPLSDADGNVGAGITLGIYDVRPIDQATGFATIAAGGVEADPYLIGKVLDHEGHVIYRAQPDLHRVYSTKVAADATYALEQVLAPGGTAAGKELADGRPAAGKTGTTTDNKDAWFVGFTPQLSTAVWMGNQTETPLTNVPGFESGVYGGTLPAQIWQQYMDAALSGQPVQQFPKPAFIGGQPSIPVPVQTATVAPTATASATATPTPTAPVPTATPTPSASGFPLPGQSPPSSPQPSGSPSATPIAQSTEAGSSPKPGRTVAP